MHTKGAPTGEKFKKFYDAEQRAFELQCLCRFSRLKPLKGYLCYDHLHKRWLECGSYPDCEQQK
jgi:hypothetical protein